jgi:putative sterol carrier protein
MQVKKTVLRSNTLALTPQESEQLSVYVSNDNYVKKQKEDIEELASLFKGMLGDTEDDNSYQYMNELKSHFYPLDDLSAVFQIDIPDENISLVLEIQEETLECSRGAAEKADVTAKVSSEVFGQILRGEKTFQSAFMAGELSAQGNFKILRNFDTIFRF